MKSKNILQITVVFVFLALTSCAPQLVSTQPVITTISLPTSTHTAITPTTVKIPTQTSTLTPLPTLSPEKALENFVNLIEKDNKCVLPCWLGVTPGKANFGDAVNSFSQFNTITSTEFSQKSAFIRVFFPEFATATHITDTEIYQTADGEVSRIWVYATVDPKGQGNITYSNEAYQKMWQRYFVPGVFSTYGPPQKIFLDTTLMAADPATSYPFALWVVYPQLGFLIRYDGLNIKTGENIRVCPMQSSIQIEIWDTETSSYEELIKDEGVGGISIGYQPIEEVTDFDVESFYETFKEGQLNTCFETPASIWPPNN